MTEIQPILLSAITCNRVIFDKVSGMPSIIDIVQTINAQRYPARHPQIVFFCELTNGHGTTKAKIRLIDAQEEEKIIFEKEGTVQFKDVKQIVTLAHLGSLHRGRPLRSDRSYVRNAPPL